MSAHKRPVANTEQMLEYCQDMLLEPVVGMHHKPTICAEAMGKSDKTDKDCLYHHRPK
jgi:hypothetical protein